MARPLKKSHPQGHLQNRPVKQKRLVRQRTRWKIFRLKEQSPRVTLEMINKNWHKIVSLIKQRSPNTAALVNYGKILGVKDGVLYLGFSEVLKTKIEKSENLDVVTQVLKQVFGFDVAVRIVASTGRQGTPPPRRG